MRFSSAALLTTAFISSSVSALTIAQAGALLQTALTLEVAAISSGIRGAAAAIGGGALTLKASTTTTTTTTSIQPITYTVPGTTFTVGGTTYTVPGSVTTASGSNFTSFVTVYGTPCK